MTKRVKVYILSLVSGVLVCTTLVVTNHNPLQAKKEEAPELPISIDTATVQQFVFNIEPGVTIKECVGVAFKVKNKSQMNNLMKDKFANQYGKMLCKGMGCEKCTPLKVELLNPQLVTDSQGKAELDKRWSTR